MFSRNSRFEGSVTTMQPNDLSCSNTGKGEEYTPQKTESCSAFSGQLPFFFFFHFSTSRTYFESEILGYSQKGLCLCPHCFFSLQFLLCFTLFCILRQPRLVSNSQQSSSDLGFLSRGITGVRHHHGCFLADKTQNY